MNRPLAAIAFSLAVSLCGTAIAQVDISNPRRLMFVADATDNIIDIVDLIDEEVVFRIETKYPIDDLVATPYAPVLVYTNIERRLVSVYDLKSQKLAREIELPIAPRHMVLDTSGTKIGFSDSVDGGFVLFSPYAAAILFTLEDFPPTSDVLFDPNEVDIYYSNSLTGSIGLIDTNTKRTFEMPVTDLEGQELSSPSRSLDGRYVYVANYSTGEVYSLNAFSKVVYRTFEIGNSPARPYTTPEGVFLYMMDKETGRFVSIDQHQFEQYEDIVIGEGIDLVTVGRFDRMNLLASSENKNFYVYDNVRKAIVESGQFRIKYISAGNTGIGAFGIGLSNNVCH